jgi:LexA DNA binding domain-containing protein
MPGEHEDFDRDRVEYEMRGKTLKVYAHLLRVDTSGVREIQRDLGFSSPSVALHHLEKLERLGVVGQDSMGRYFIAKKVDVGILSAFTSIGRLTLPRLGFYAAFFSTIALAYVLEGSTPADLYALIGTVGGAVVFWYEAWRAWRKRPF